MARRVAAAARYLARMEPVAVLGVLRMVAVLTLLGVFEVLDPRVLVGYVLVEWVTISAGQSLTVPRVRVEP